VEAVGIVAAEHPIITEASDRAAERARSLSDLKQSPQ
jgi:hypothetical protein